MDIEQKLRELLVPRDPGVTFTDGVLSRVGDVPDAPSGEGVVRLSDARARSRGRRMLIGAVLVASAAAAMLPFLQDRDGGQSVEQEIPSVPVPMGESMEADASLPANPPEASGGEVALDCIDPDILHGLLLPGTAGQGFRITDAVPVELASFKPPQELSWLGTSERSGAAAASSAVYRTSLAPEPARAAAASALAAAGWQLHSGGPSLGKSIFVAGGPFVPAQTYCREGMPVNVSAGALDGVTYVVLSLRRAKPGLDSCGQLPPMRQVRSPLDDYLPTLESPVDPATGLPVALRGSGSSSGIDRQRANISFTLKSSVEAVSRHFASQMAGQGWSADTTWSGTDAAGTTWSRRMDTGKVLHARVSVSAFGNDRFAVVFSAVTTN